jgi:hypothetical protein
MRTVYIAQTKNTGKYIYKENGLYFLCYGEVKNITLSYAREWVKYWKTRNMINPMKNY